MRAKPKIPDTFANLSPYEASIRDEQAHRFRDERERYVAALGLTYRDQDDCNGSSFQVYTLPAGDGRRYDRRVLIVVYPDGSWRPYLDIPNHNTADRVLRTLTMAELLNTAPPMAQGHGTPPGDPFAQLD